MQIFYTQLQLYQMKLLIFKLTDFELQNSYKQKYSEQNISCKIVHENEAKSKIEIMAKINTILLLMCYKYINN